jgi:hypothetical protein
MSVDTLGFESLIPDPLSQQSVDILEVQMVGLRLD